MAYRFLVDKVIKSPFKFYRNAAASTFCVVGATNFGYCLVNEQQYENFYAFHDVFCTGVLLKSLKYGLIFPAFYVKAFSDPYAAFYLGGISDRFGKDHLIKEFYSDDEIEANGKEYKTKDLKLEERKLKEESYKIYGTIIPDRFKYEAITNHTDECSTTTVLFNGYKTTRTLFADGSVTITRSKKSHNNIPYSPIDESTYGSKYGFTLSPHPSDQNQNDQIQIKQD